MAYHRPARSTEIEPGIWQTQQGKYVCATCGSFNWHLDRMRKHTATPHLPCRWCGDQFTHPTMHEWKCPKRVVCPDDEHTWEWNAQPIPVLRACGYRCTTCGEATLTRPAPEPV